jgi:hypothetical protein
MCQVPSIPFISLYEFSFKKLQWNEPKNIYLNIDWFICVQWHFDITIYIKLEYEVHVINLKVSSIFLKNFY